MESTKRQSGFKLPIVSAVALTKVAVEVSYFLDRMLYKSICKEMHLMCEKLYMIYI